METSAACITRLATSSIIFFNQSHVEFHHLTPKSVFAVPSLFLVSSPLRRSLPIAPSWSPAISPLRALRESASASHELDPLSEQATLMKELVELKLQLKQKKKQLKAQKGDEKRRLKMENKEGRKKIRQSDPIDGKKTKKCSSPSSPSLESTDDKCMSTSMGMLSEGCGLLANTEEGAKQNESAQRIADLSARLDVDGVITGSSEVSCTDASFSGGMHNMTEVLSDLDKDHTQRHQDRASSIVNCGTVYSDASILCADRQRQGVPSVTCRRNVFFVPSVQSPSRIEVCAGGKCRKAGSERLLQALRSQIPISTSHVEVVPCKCMGKCSMAVNVKVRKEDRNPQHHSHVGADDANLILSQHFRFSRPQSGLPSLPSRNKFMGPVPASVQAGGVKTTRFTQ